MAYFRKNLLVFIFLFILVLITYGNSLNNVFLSDDLAEIVQNPNIGKFSNILSHPFGFIRPFLYWLAYNLAGLSPPIFRSINILFHTGSTLLIFTILHRLHSRRLAFFVAAIFAVHPAISEAVVWVSGGSYPQYAFFFLLSFLFYLSANQRKSFYLLSTIFYLLSFMSHPQMPLALFLIFPLFELSFGTLKKNWPKVIPFVIISLAYLVISLSGLGERETTLQTTHYQEKGVDNPFLLVPIALTSYFELIFFPKTLTLYHSELAFGPINFSIRATLILIFLGGILYFFKKSKFVFFWGMFFLLALSPTLTPFRLNWIVAERYNYLPIIGISAIVTFVLDRLCQIDKLKKIIFVLFVIMIISLSIRTIVRNIDWKNEDNLWIATGKTSPSSPNTHNNLGDVYGRWGDKQAALREFQKAIELKGNYGDAYHNLANTYVELGQLDKALENYQNAIKFNPSLWQSYQNIASIYFNQKQFDKSLEYVQKAIAINPKKLNLRVNLGIVYLGMGEKEKAKEVFSAVLAIDPTDTLAKSGLLQAQTP